MPDNDFIIHVDYREGKSKVIDFLKRKGVKSKINTKQITDYIIDRQCGVERKTINDFINSIIDKRIFRQVDTLKANFLYPLIIIEGGGLYKTKREIHSNVIRGILLWINVFKKVPIIRTYNQEDTAEMIRLLLQRRKFYKNKSFSLRYKKSPISFYKQQESLLESIPSIGPKLAGSLLRHLGSIKSILSASIEELEKVRGIGNKKATKIKLLLGS